MSNPYAPPRDIDEEYEGTIERRQRSAQFFGVSTSTLAVLQFVTFGVYAVYWFYRHWAVQKRVRRLSISPLARGIFAIFFAHRLFQLIDRGARATGISPRWKYRSEATLYVVLVLLARVLVNLGSDGQGFMIGMALNAASILPLVAAQRIANQANGRSLLPDDVEEEEEDD